MVGPGAVVMSCSRVVDVFIGANALLEVREREDQQKKKLSGRFCRYIDEKEVFD